MGLSFTACSDDDYNPMPIQLTNVTTLDDMNTPITEAAMGDFIAIHGTGLDVRNIDSVLINDVALDMLEVYTESDILFLKIPVKLPKEETNKIYIYNSTGRQEIPFKANVGGVKRNAINRVVRKNSNSLDK